MPSLLKLNPARIIRKLAENGLEKVHVVTVKDYAYGSRR